MNCQGNPCNCSGSQLWDDCVGNTFGYSHPTPKTQEVSLVIEEGIVRVQTPYNKEAIAAFKNLGCRWNPQAKVWYTTEEKASELCKIVNTIFGSEFEAPAEEVEEELVDIKLKIDDMDSRGLNLRYLGKTLVSAAGVEVKLGEDVELLKGSFSYERCRVGLWSAELILKNVKKSLVDTNSDTFVAFV